MVTKYDFVVVGGGSAGFGLASRVARAGFQVALVEKGPLGGTCPNYGCIPTKDLIQGARVASHARRSGEFGIAIEGPVQVDLAKVIEIKDDFVARMLKHAHRQVAENKNLNLYQEKGVFISPEVIQVGHQQISGDKIVVSTGGQPLLPPLEGLDKVDYLTSTSALQLKKLPAELVIIGGGIIAVEFAQMFARFGSRVTVLQRSHRLVPNVEEEISAELLEIFTQENIRVVLNADVKKVVPEENKAVVTARDKNSGEEANYPADKVLIATSRKPNTADLGLDNAGITTDGRGYIQVDDGLKTSAARVWAIGDVTGPPMFTSTARHDSYLLRQHFLKGEKISTADRLVPYAIFTDPEIASVGLSQADAARTGVPLDKIVFPFRFLGRARAMKEGKGFIKLIFNKETEKILGAHLIGPHAGELIHELIMALRFGATLEDLREGIHVHPTLAEGFNYAALTY